MGVLTNHTGCALDGTPTCQVLRALGINIVALFSPEHGPQGTREGHIESGQTAEGTPVFSLYGDTRRPTPAMLDGIEVLVCDIQDVGARFYTYASTLALCLEVCLPLGIEVVVLDRPNPLGGEVAGPMVEDEHRSFVGHLRVPVQHGLTIGELARLHVRDEELNKAGLHVLLCEGWEREMHWPQTRLPWAAPSPNLPNFKSAAWYPALCLAEFSQVAVGRGTEAPFQIVGTPWLKAEDVVYEMQNWPNSIARDLRPEFLTFQPQHALYEDEICRGIRFRARDNFAPPQPVAFGMALLSTLHRVHPDKFVLDKALPLLGSSSVLEMLRSGLIEGALARAEADALDFVEKRENILLYG